MLFKATQAADVLKAHIREIAGDDIDVIADTIEGEIDLRGLICLAAEENLRDTTMTKAIRQMEDDLAARRDRIEKRIALRKVAILVAMQSGEIQKIETPAGTISRKAVPPSALILDEAAIPAEFWKPQDPKLDKKAVLDALKAKQDVPGAQLSNGGETIQTRI
jgi:hypothetical protein